MALSSSTAILMYHLVVPDVAPAFHKYTVTPQAFAQQMRWLARWGYTPITLDTLLEARAGLRKLPPRAVVITFDDGFQGCVDYAVPILLEHRFTAVFYLVAGLMGGPSTWLEAERGMTFPLMDWATARQLVDEGFTCGTHTLTHPRLAQVDSVTCYQELYESRRLLEERLNTRVLHLAYPFGSFNADVRACAMQVGYRSACTTIAGCSPYNDDSLALRRVPICGQDTLLDFICRLGTARTVRELLRDGAKQLRRAQLSPRGIA